MFRFAQTETERDLREDKGSYEGVNLGALWGGIVRGWEAPKQTEHFGLCSTGEAPAPQNKKAPSTRAPGSNPTTGAGGEMQILRYNVRVNVFFMQKKRQPKVDDAFGTKLARTKFKL